MVRLTQSLLKYIPDWYHLRQAPSSYFKKQTYLYLNRFNKTKAWSESKHARNRFEYHLKGEMYFARLKSQHLCDINRMRIDSACEEHGYTYHQLKTTLPKIDINLNLSSLARLAIYEPQTFKSLIDISREVSDTQIRPANFTNENIDLKEDMPREFIPKQIG